MSRIFGLAALVLLMLLLLHLPTAQGLFPPLSLQLGFLMLAAFVAGKLGAYAHLPGITGYLLAGILFGPALLGFLDERAVSDLSAINRFALTLIALTAGGEVDLRRVRQRLSSYSLVTVSQVVVVFFGVLAVVWSAGGMFLGSVSDGTDRFVFALLLAVVALAKSPSSTVAVIVETGARGRVSELALGITILKDIVVILCFAAALAWGESLLGGGDSAGTWGLAADLGWEIGGSVLLGVALGLGIILYMRHVGEELTLLIVAASFLTSELSHALHLHELLLCMSAGITVKNASGRGTQFIAAIERGSLPIYVVFFAIAGASLNFRVLAESWRLVLIVTGARLLFTWLGTSLGAALAREETAVRQNLWLGFMTQAGLSLGMAVLIAGRFPVWGATFKNVVIGSITLFQVAGPAMFKFGLSRAGEIKRGL